MYLVQFYNFNKNKWVFMKSFFNLKFAEYFVFNSKEEDEKNNQHFQYRILKVVEFYD